MARTKKIANNARLLEVARLRYEEGLTNGEIAVRLDVGPKKVAEILNESVRWLLSERTRLSRMELGDDAKERLEQRLRDKFPVLKKVIIVPIGKIETEEDYAKLIRRWAVAGADYFDELVDSGEFRDSNDVMRVSMSGGETLLEVMNALNEHPRRKVIFYAGALLGRARLRSASHVDPATNATIAWARSGRLSGHCIYATLSPSEQVYNLASPGPLKERMLALRKELEFAATNKPVQAVIEELADVTVAFAGLGLVNPPKGSQGLMNRLTGTGLLKTSIRERELADDGAIGDLAYNFFDKDGNGRDEWQFFLTAGHYAKRTRGLEFYRNMVKQDKRVIVVAGTYKANAILAALKGKLFNVWVTDDRTAKQVLDAGLR